MQYELYSFHGKENRYCFEKESDDIQELLAYALQENLPKYLNDVDTDRCQWIYLDNAPSEYNILQLGFTTVPTAEECRRRILDCKIAKYLYQHQLLNIGEYDFNTYSESYQELAKTASHECDAICAKLFTYFPVMHFLVSGNKRFLMRK